MDKEKKYVPNEVFKFSCWLKDGLDGLFKTVYTKPITNPKEFMNSDNLNACADLVEKQYFTKERINQMKQELIEKIQNTENPFNIYLNDFDGNHNVTEDMLFDVDTSEIDSET